MKFSIVVPALNEEKIIEKCLRSIRNQDYPKKDYEIVVVDGDSSDRTREIARKYGRVVVEKKKGIAHARNVGARHSRGDIIIFIDADTILSNNLLSEMSRAYSDPKVVGATVKILPDPRTTAFMFNTSLINVTTKITSRIGRVFGTTICVSCRASAFRKLNGFKDKMLSGEDMDFVFRLSRMGRFRVLSNVYAITSMRRIAAWGQLYFVYRYLQGSGLFGLSKEKREYGRVE